jgi:hypothetical protein
MNPMLALGQNDNLTGLAFQIFLFKSELIHRF